MTDTAKPARRPASPNFSSGPCAKRPDWSLNNLASAPLGRSHRSSIGKGRLKDAIDRTRDMLRVPDDYRVGIVPASDTGAVEMAMWSMLGARGVDIFFWESFGKDWATDTSKQLKLDDVRLISADYGALPDLDEYDSGRDVVFTWNGTTSGVRVPNADWIAEDREGVVICDATSAAFAQDLDWSKLDVVTFSWQKCLGGEAAHGVLILSPRAVERLETFEAPRPLPKLFRMTKNGKLNEAIFEGATINTPSMLCVEDYLDALKWAGSVGGLDGLFRRADANAKVLNDWMDASDWAANLAEVPATRSNTSVCFKITDPRVAAADEADQKAFVKKLCGLLEKEGVALDIAGYRDAPPGLRVWCGPTVETDDLDALTPWLDWAFEATLAELNLA